MAELFPHSPPHGNGSPPPPLLEKRFGPLAPEVLARLESATPELVERYFDRGVDAASLVDVFGE